MTKKQSPTTDSDFDDEDCPICAACRQAEAAGHNLTLTQLKSAFAVAKKMGYMTGTGEDLEREERLN